MSYFICGNIKKSSNNDINLLVSEIMNLSQNEELHFHLGDQIPQKIVFEILAIDNNDEINKTPFLLTKTLQSDTSDDLLSPYVIGIKEGNYLSALGNSLKNIQNLIIALHKNEIIDAIEMYFSEGYDTTYELIHTTFGNFAGDILKKCEENDIPSIKVIVHSCPK